MPGLLLQYWRLQLARNAMRRSRWGILRKRTDCRRTWVRGIHGGVESGCLG